MGPKPYYLLHEPVMIDHLATQTAIAGISAVVACIAVLITIRQAKQSGVAQRSYLEKVSEIATSAKHLEVLNKAYAELSAVTQKSFQFVEDSRLLFTASMSTISSDWRTLFDRHISESEKAMKCILEPYYEKEREKYDLFMRDLVRVTYENGQLQGKIQMELRKTLEALMATNNAERGNPPNERPPTQLGSSNSRV